MRAVLENILTDDVYADAMPIAEQLEKGIAKLIKEHGVPWHVVRVGLRAEIVNSERPPKNGTEALMFAHSEVEHALHLFCLNRGVVITPFHNMMLVCPETKGKYVRRLIEVLEEGMEALSNA